MNSAPWWTWVTTGLALVGTVLNIRKVRWCFAIWLVTNLVWCCRNFAIGETALGVQFAVYAVLSVIGWISWKPERSYPHPRPLSQQQERGDCRRPLIRHELKCWPQYFADIRSGRKSFEVRRDDRPFSAGDVLVLREWDPKSTQYTGRQVHRKVTYVLRDPVFLGSEDLVVMAIRPAILGRW